MATTKGHKTGEVNADTPPLGAVVSGGGRSGLFGTRRQILAMSGVVLLAVLLAGALVAYKMAGNRQATTDVASKKVCTQTQLKAASLAIAKNSQTDLEKAVKSITANATYAKDPNCLYVVAKYYAGTGDTTKVNKTIAEFYQVYDSKQGLNTELTTTPTESVQKLQQSVQKQNQEIDGVQSEIQSQI